MSRRPTLVSLFAGAGGLDAGLERAGFDLVTATDFDHDCMETQRLSKDAAIPMGRGKRLFLSRARFVEAPIGELVGRDLAPPRSRRDWRPDLLAGGPPCQPFSSSGKMLALDDPRGHLFLDFVRVAEEVQPRYILLENVRGLVTSSGPSGEPGEVLAQVKAAFEDIGYATTFALLNSADFGAPQRRVRMFMLATRDGVLPRFPDPTHQRGGGDGLFDSGVRPWVTLGEFLASWPDPADEEIVKPTPELAARLAEVPDGSGVKSPGAREATRPGGHWGYKQGTFIADQSLPARTVTASTQDWVREPDGSLRRLTVSEAAGLQGFPEGWDFYGSKASQFRQVGNAVPAVFGQALGMVLIKALRTPATQVPESAPLPKAFHAAIDYTRRDRARNQSHRRKVAQAMSQGDDVRKLKGLGSATCVLPSMPCSQRTPMSLNNREA